MIDKAIKYVEMKLVDGRADAGLTVSRLSNAEMDATSGVGGRRVGARGIFSARSPQEAASRADPIPYKE